MDIALKQRLVGATVLIALAVVVVPMFLGGGSQDGEQDSQKIELPPQPADLDFQTRRYPVGESAARQPSGDTEPQGSIPSLPQPAAGSVTEPEQPAHVEIQPREFEDALAGAEGPGGAPPATASETTMPSKDPGEATVPPVAEATETGGAATESAASSEPATGAARYVVQIASFGSIANANRLSEDLRKQGYDVLSDTVQSDVGVLHRVRVGPYRTEAEAGGAANRIRQKLADVRPRIVDLQPEQAAQVTMPSDPLVRWVVQVGSFSSVDNANTLVERLRAQGLSAYQEAVSTGGTTIYRVRTGPYLEREEALRADARIFESLALDGVVMSEE